MLPDIDFVVDALERYHLMYKTNHSNRFKKSDNQRSNRIIFNEKHQKVSYYFGKYQHTPNVCHNFNKLNKQKSIELAEAS